MENWTLASPLWLALGLAIPAVLWLRGRRGQNVFAIPHVARWSGREPLRRSRVPVAAGCVGLLLLAVAMARPQKFEERKEVRQEGYDIVLAIDLSGSMLAEDTQVEGRRINRLQALKPIIEAFMNRRETDRIGVVTFGGQAYTLAPLSFDHRWLRGQIERLQVGLVEDGTAVGDALSLAVSRLGQPGRMEDGRRKGGFVILLTDGANNAGTMDPLQAAQIAESRGIPVYTIGAGREGRVPMPVFDEEGRKLGYRDVVSDLDEATLARIASQTGGRYFRAVDADTVNRAFAAIDAERVIEFDGKASLRTHEYFAFAGVPGLAFFLLAFMASRFRSPGGSS